MLDGTVVKWSDNASEAIQSLWTETVFWPEPKERAKIKDRILTQFGVPDCVGFIDGVNMVLNCAPTRPGKSAATYYGRKGFYGLNVVCVVDDKKRIRMVHYGFTAASNDYTVQAEMEINAEPERFLEDNEMIIGDSGFQCEPWLLSMCRRGRGQPHLQGLNVSSDAELSNVQADQTGLLQLQGCSSSGNCRTCVRYT
jgi:hypothetical protein